MIVRGREQRRHTRLPIDLQYSLEFESKKYSGHISNISLSGVYLATIEPNFPTLEGTHPVTLNIKTYKGWEALSCMIVYVGSNDEFFPDGAGVAFCSTDFETVSLIWNLSIQYLVQDEHLFIPLAD